jgi:hypothetical protein
MGEPLPTPSPSTHTPPDYERDLVAWAMGKGNVAMLRAGPLSEIDADHALEKPTALL